MKKQILVAGNDRAIHQSFQNWMQNQDIEVSCVPSVADALDTVLKCEYCLAVLSLRFTEASDVELLRMIRSTKRMPIDFPGCIAQATSLIRLFLEAQGADSKILSNSRTVDTVRLHFHFRLHHRRENFEKNRGKA